MQAKIDKLVKATDKLEAKQLEKRDLVIELRDSLIKQRELELKIIKLENSLNNGK